METADPVVRWARAVVLAAVASLVAVVAHAGSGGRLPSVLVLVLVVAALAVLAHPLLARRASAVRVVALTVGGQTLAHAVLGLTAGHHGDASRPASVVPARVSVPLPVDADGRRVGSLLDHARAARSLHEGPASLPDPVSHLLRDVTSAGAPMLLAHVAAAVLVGSWLAAGERALWTMLTLAWRAMVLLRPAARPVPAHPAVAPVVAVLVPRRVAAGGVVRRGPPLLLAA